MDREDFRAWRVHMGFNRTEAAAALGMGRNMPQRYEDGETEIPNYVALACSALDRKLGPWKATEAQKNAAFERKMSRNLLGFMNPDD